MANQFLSKPLHWNTKPTIAEITAIKKTLNTSSSYIPAPTDKITCCINILERFPKSSKWLFFNINDIKRYNKNDQKKLSTIIRNR